ncbi:extracellular solute-binding protein [Paenibacillus sp. BR2-3]|uniref:ABC transporter substrate-binding protein n=1 Tax=Paenibacillus sp. BR2-3 TaxID=3048494 RepID=UPI0039778090
MLKRKNYWLLFAILLLSLTSLSPSLELKTSDGPRLRSNPENQSALPSSGEKGNVGPLRITVSLSDAEFRELQFISGRYTLSSGVRVELINRDSDSSHATLLNDLTVGDSPDIIMTDGRNILDLATRGYLLPVDVYQRTPGSTPLTGLIPLLQWNGYDWGVPLDIDPYVFVYSPERLAELGIEKLPRSLEEWSSLLQNVRKTKGKSLLALDTRNPYGYSAFLKSVGSHLLSEDSAPLEWTQEARSDFYLTSRYNEDVWDMLQEGTLTVAALPLSEWQTHGSANLAVEAPLIESNDNGLDSLESRCFAVSAQSLYPEEAVNWLSYITSRPAQLEWLELTGRLPALDELYRSGLPGMDPLPFRADILLTDDTAPVEQTKGGWSKVSAAVASLLTSKMDAAGYKKALQ